MIDTESGGDVGEATRPPTVITERVSQIYMVIIIYLIELGSRIQIHHVVASSSNWKHKVHHHTVNPSGISELC